MVLLGKIFFGGCFIYVSIAYAIRRVWLLNHREHDEDVPVRFTGGAILKFIREYAYLCLHLLLLLADYILTPFNFILKNRSAPCEYGTQPPVILIHGYMMRGGVLWPMLSYLKKRGFNRVFKFTYEVPWKEISYFAEQLADEVDKVISTCKAKKVDLVAHSMGGLVARYYINYLGGDKLVARLVTLGTPHNGSLLWALSSFKSGAQMRPGSRFLTHLAENDQKLQAVKTWSIYSDFDELILPEDSPIMEGKNITNRKIPDLGHVGLIYNRRACQEVVEILRR
jgi:pimeloyl-ACP methyl ester carboxylesterase